MFRPVQLTTACPICSEDTSPRVHIGGTSCSRTYSLSRILSRSGWSQRRPTTSTTPLDLFTHTYCEIAKGVTLRYHERYTLKDAVSSCGWSVPQPFLGAGVDGVDWFDCIHTVCSAEDLGHDWMVSSASTLSTLSAQWGSGATLSTPGASLSQSETGMVCLPGNLAALVLRCGTVPSWEWKTLP